VGGGAPPMPQTREAEKGEPAVEEPKGKGQKRLFDF